MIREIAAGRFFPDNSRSSYFPKRVEQGDIPEQRPSDNAAGVSCLKPVKIEVISSDESEEGEQETSESESSKSSSSSSAGEEAQPVVRRWKRATAKVSAADQVWYVHTGSGVLHLLASPEEAPMLLSMWAPGQQELSSSDERGDRPRHGVPDLPAQRLMYK